MEKLFELDPYLTHFTACVQSCVQSRKGWDVILDQTAFYPEGGGQPYDLGTLGGTSVLEVHEREGHVVHTCDRPLEPGSQVEGDIDWPRRFDLMQHHSGEHIVSGIAHARYGCENVGFHMGSDVITIDLSVELTQEQVRELEEAANRYIWEDHPIQIAFPSPQELEVLTYRSKKALTGRVRIVSFPGADTCACCGTHVSSSGQVGLVKLLSCQKFRSGVRMEILCGKRAWQYLGQVYDQARAVGQHLSVKPVDVGGAVERLSADLMSRKQRAAAMETELFFHKAEAFRGKGDVLLVEPAMSGDSTRRLADAVAKTCGALRRYFRRERAVSLRPGPRRRGGYLDTGKIHERRPFRTGRRAKRLCPGQRRRIRVRRPGLFQQSFLKGGNSHALHSGGI